MWIAPDGTRITGTLEVIKGCTNGIDDIEADGTPVYDSNGTEVNWDGQEQAVDENGKPIFLDEDGYEWTFDWLTEVPGDGEDEHGRDISVPFIVRDDGVLDQFIRTRVAWKLNVPPTVVEFDGGVFALAFSGRESWTVDEAIALIDEYATRYGIYPAEKAAT